MEYTKKALRKYVKEYRSRIKPEEKAIWDKGLLANLQPFHLEKEKVVYAYISVNGEAETGPLIEELLSAGVRVAVPLVVKTSTDKWLHSQKQEQDSATAEASTTASLPRSRNIRKLP